MKEIISQEIIENFLHGENPEKYIVAIHYDYGTNTIYKVIQDPEKGKIIKTDKLIAFLWCDSLLEMNFYNGNKSLQKTKMIQYGILIEKLETKDNERLNKGHKFLIKSLKGYSALINFFKSGGIDPWGDKYKKHFTTLTPVEQYMIHNKIRLFKGIEEYDEIHRMVFDIETTGLKPENNKIILIGVKDNRGFKKTISAFGEDGERKAIIEFFEIIKKINPTIIGGYNSASFDFPFILKRAEILNLDIKKLTAVYGSKHMKQRDGMLKLANEVESYLQFELFGFNIIDISHAVRRAQAIDSEIKSWSLKYITKFIDKQKPNRVYVEGSKISKIYLENESYYMNPKTGKYKKIGTPGTENLMDRFPNVYEIWNGDRIVEQYLDDDLYETMVVDDSFSQSTFLLSKLVPTTYERAATMGTATLWKLIMLAWSYDNKLAIPSKIEKRKFTGGLSRLLNVGFSKNVVKFDFASLYPSIQLVYDIFPECDVMGVQKSMLKYFRNIRIKNKRLASEYKDSNTALSEMYDRKQLPIKIFINGYFGSLSAPQVFPWSEMDKGETITCIGRQCLRMMIMFFMKKGYKPLVMDTDGVNFETPENLNETTYVGKGLNELVEEGKVYKGLEADTAEFNDIFMRNEMGLDIDYVSQATINISKKNYIVKLIKKGKEKIKLTGNTIKSKVLQQYIADFLNDGLKHLLNGDGHAFVELYYEYVEKIYNKKIPLAKIANKSKMKQTIDEYKVYITKKTKAGTLMARQAHMELVLQNNYPATLGEMIYYVNNGQKKNDGDVMKKNRWTKKEMKKYYEEHGVPMPINHELIIINSYMIPEKDINENPEMIGDYNVARYMSTFNKRIEPLLVVFKPEIRDDIIVENPNDRKYFTKTQLELVNGFPLKENTQDSFEEVMTLSDTEVDFWNRMNIDPYFIYFEDSITHIDETWVEHNRQVLKDKKLSVQNNEDEILGVSDENDDKILHASYV
jgi:DNA polymerase elongation subunit (family B)